MDYIGDDCDCALPQIIIHSWNGFATFCIFKFSLWMFDVPSSLAFVIALISGAVVSLMIVASFKPNPFYAFMFLFASPYLAK